MKILILDIETFPNLCWTWGLWQQNIAPSQVVRGQYVACWAAKWLGKPEMYFDSVKSGTKEMLYGIHALLDEADVVVHQNGKRFDVPMLNTEFIKNGIKPPSPFRQVDLKETSKRQFRFPSSKLEYITTALGFGEKIKTDFSLWTECMAGKAGAWRLMEKYNKKDVTLTEKLYKMYLPWISNHPNQGSYRTGGSQVCPNCGGRHYERRGYYVVSLKPYPKLHCLNSKCGRWFRSNVAEPNKKIVRYVGI